MKKYKHKKIYVTICPECKKLISCYRFNRLRKMCGGKFPYCYCEKHALWESKIITENDFVILCEEYTTRESKRITKKDIAFAEKDFVKKRFLDELPTFVDDSIKVFNA